MTDFESIFNRLSESFDSLKGSFNSLSIAFDTQRKAFNILSSAFDLMKLSNKILTEENDKLRSKLEMGFEVNSEEETEDFTDPSDTDFFGGEFNGK